MRILIGNTWHLYSALTRKMQMKNQNVLILSECNSKCRPAERWQQKQRFNNQQAYQYMGGGQVNKIHNIFINVNNSFTRFTFVS